MKIEKNVFGFGIQGVDANTATPGFLGARKLSAVSDLGPEDLARAYLRSRDDRGIGKTFGHVRMVQASTRGATPGMMALAVSIHMRS